MDESMAETIVFDAHVHIWADDRRTYPQVPGMERRLALRGSAEWLIDPMDAQGVRGALLVQAPWYGEDNRYFVDAMCRYPGRFAALGYLLDPLAPDAPDKLARQHHEDGFRGIRIHLIEPRIVEGVASGHAGPILRPKARRRAHRMEGSRSSGAERHPGRHGPLAMDAGD
jgi:predicted TIM-barrel fold metal-dependent hydrolase